jgi:tetratricopeptide (TPR) repeat protein
LDDAQALIDGVAREIEDALGEREPRLPSVLYLSGVAALARGDLAAAQPTLRRARELDADVLPSERGALDTALARALIADPAARGECNELARSALAQGDRPAAFVARWVLARLALAERRAADAETELRAAIEADPTATGWPTAACRELLAEILIARGELDEGCAMLESAVPALERALGARHADVLEVRTRLAQNGVTASCAARAR